MGSESTDLRVMKTRAAIQSAFLDLLQEKSFNVLTIKDIASAAKIGRGTFYLHYVDKYELLEMVIEKGLSETIDHFHPHDYFLDGQAIPERITAFIQSIFRHFKKNARFFKAMFFNEGIPMFRQRMQKRFLDKFQAEVRQLAFPNGSVDPLMLEILPIFLSSAMIGLVSWWLEQHMRIPEEEVAQRIFLIFTRGPLRALGFSFKA
ncbi:TetR/AcrR family transcriptional regulator [Sporolactobacillus nakayamae]|uniref:Transcriptional regulator, TetR family n=1 Tax=Sporolactobacillus nakayamae TaxID=269670 RepID=A0A1I2VLC3_9BACL|nr:TetR/AcrR family transcriptional regulator C-terminal domain-containing protein [Sporolactobacillus nakayamae]SFG89883.1 transcriptional regulator, TetR family [Sporolactobacillus nakayamae]